MENGYVYSHLFKTTLKVTGALSTKFNWAGREDKANKYIQSENDYMVEMYCNARQFSISNCTHPDDHIIQSCAKSKSLLHILLWVSKSFSQLQRAIISKHGTS